MSFLSHLFGREDVAQASRMFTQFGPDVLQDPKAAAAELAAGRRDMMRMVLHKTLTRHGIPAAWIGCEMLVATSRGRQPGMHWRLLIKHWDPRLLTHAVALQNSLVVRLIGYDPTAADWLMGVSWQFSLADEGECPALPQPGFWTASRRPLAATPRGPDPAPEPSADLIAGPVRIGSSLLATQAGQPETRDSVRHDLDKLLAVRDAEMQRHMDLYGAPQATRPMYLNTERQPLAATPRELSQL